MGRLIGMKEICEHLKRSDATVLKLYHEQDLPIRQIGGIWESSTEAIAEWHKQQLAGAPKPRTGHANGQKRAKKQAQRRF